MNDDCKKAVLSIKTLGCVLTMVVLTAAVVSWFVWGPFGGMCYLGGLFNSSLAFVLFVLLSSMAPLLVICALALAMYTVFRWSWLDARRKGRYVFAAIVLLAWPVSYGLESRGVIPTPVPFNLFARGLARYVDRRVDIGAVQSWLGTLDPNDCEGQPLDARVASDADIDPAPKYVPTPPSLARLVRHNNRLTRDDRSRPMICITLGGGGFNGCWGLEVGSPDMPMPTSDSRLLYYPLAPGAYIWSDD